LVSELFFSRTDKKGWILSGNEVFQRVSKYDWSELIDRPHNLIRHPFMPKGVFHLLWETILEGKPIGAYVINKAKDGSHYWVFALVAPLDDGFLSIRLKPTSEILNHVKNVYSEVLKQEKQKSLKPKESQEVLLGILKKLGFESYEDFMTTSLIAEVQKRENSLRGQENPILEKLTRALKHGINLEKTTEETFEHYKVSQHIPLNLEVQANKGGDEGAPISVVAHQYENLSNELNRELSQFQSAGQVVQESIRGSQFLLASFLLQSEMHKEFIIENSDHINVQEELKHLKCVADQGRSKVQEALDQIKSQLQLFIRVENRVRDLATALEMVRVTGKIEVSKVTKNKKDLEVLLESLLGFREKLQAALKEIHTNGMDLINLHSEIDRAVNL